jgi:glucosamine--fructose-6-phosphate aminotransferase (isomerizing)
LILAQDDATRQGLEALSAELAARGVDVLIAGGGNANVTRLPTVASQAALAPVLMAASVYRMLAQLAVYRGQDPDRPPHLRKVTGTV